MSSPNLSFHDVVQIVELLKSSTHFDEFHLKTADLEVDIKRCAQGAGPVSTPSVVVHKAKDVATTPHQPQVENAVTSPIVTPDPEPASVAQSTRTQQKLDIPADAILVKSPMVGTFYRAPEPGAPPFVEVGQEADEMTTVCLIEVMKLINSIPAGQKGVVSHIYVGDGEPVEYGQILMALSPR